MTYEEAIEVTVSKQEARIEIEAHSLSFDDFVNECGDADEYEGSEVLSWLGY